MLKRNAPVLAFFLVFVAVLYFVYSIPQYEPVIEVEEEEEVVEDAFTGRVMMPSIDEIYVIENTAGRDLNKLSSEYFKKIRVRRKGGRYVKSDDDVFLGLHLTLDSLGRFKDPQIMFSDSDNEVFKVKLLKHVEYFWRLPPSKQGKLEMWIPIRFHAI